MTPIIVIPARMAASRFPGKPLAPIAGRAMILRVVDFAKSANVGPVLVAAGDEEIFDVVRADGGDAVMTDPSLSSGTDRVFAGLQAFDPNGDFDTVLNLQGDAPGIDPAPLQQALSVLENNPDTDIATLAMPANDIADNPNAVKVILANAQTPGPSRALYFTRANAPFGDGPLYKHIGLYGFRRRALERFCSLAPSSLEQRENLEQLRALEAGMVITAAICDEGPPSVDTPADLPTVEALFKQEF